MTCHSAQIPGFGRAIVCTSTRRCKCGRRATLLCDWKVKSERVDTCDKPICDRCTTSPAPDKDLCPAHARDYHAWKAERNQK